MAMTTLRDTPVHTVGELPAVGDTVPPYTLTGADMTDFSSAAFAGTRVVLNIFPSIDTGTCAASVRRFNQIAAGLENTTVVCASADLPYAMRRFCGAEGIEDVTVGSSFRSSFGTDGRVLHTQLVPDIGTEPDYDAAVTALG
jgi:thioredoxin-dependent peroxiredoxin